MARVAATINTAKAPPRAPAKVNRAPAKVNTPTVRTPAKVNTPVRAPAKVQSTPVRSTANTRTAATPSYSGGGGASSSGGFSGGGADFSGAASVAPVEAAPVMQDITIPDPLENEVYKRQKGELARARADFDAQQLLARNQYGASFDDAQRQLGWRSAVPRVGAQAALRGAGNDEAGFDPNAQGTSYSEAYQGNLGDFAGRGLLHSGMAAQATSNLNQMFNDRRGTALRDKKAYEDTQGLNAQNYYGQQDAADLSAREDAINSIIQQFGVDRNQVTPGRQNVIQRQV